MSDSTPICRCRVLYLGSSVPQVTKDGLQGIQEPLQELYPEQGAIGARGIDSWLSVWSNGILLENVDENHKKITRFFPIDSLHYCAAIRYVLVPEKNTLHTPTPRFLPLDSPFARAPNPAHPPLFAAILRRTSGIKVLECHSFICKREVAANALVRCCFHAYADSSYAKQVEGNSVYGTLNSERETKEKVEDWKIGPRSQSGSTMTINSVGNTKDDVSIYNGDENHKVWAGSQDNLDSIYDVYSTSTLNRPQRPRQVAQPVPVPPPPAPKEKPKKSKSKKSHKEDIYMNGYGKANSISGTMMHPKNRGHIHQGGPQPMYIMSPHHGHPLNASTTLPNPKFFKYHGNTYSHRQNSKKLLIPARPIPPPFVPIGNLGPGGHGPVGHGPGGHAGHGPVNHGPVGHPGHVGHGPVGHVSHLGPVGPMGQILMPSPTTLNKKTKKNKHHHSQINLALEEPIYLPSPRTPNAAPIPIPDAYFSHHGNQVYATMESPRSSGTKQKKDKHVQNGHVNGKLDKETAKLLMMRDKKFAKSMNGLDHAEEPPVNLAEESPFNTGIYRKKGHLNERAFSYSIRQEHRSRSYGSLANLKFASSIPNGVNEMEDTREDIKKEREIMQMVQDLDLSGDEIERSEVPRGMYDNRAMPPALGGPTVIVNGNRGHRR